MVYKMIAPQKKKLKDEEFLTWNSQNTLMEITSSKSTQKLPVHLANQT